MKLKNKYLPHLCNIMEQVNRYYIYKGWKGGVKR